MANRRQSWPAALAGGVAGTAAMTLTLGLRSRIWPSADGLVDYDASDHVVIAASKVVRWNPQSKAGRRVLFNIVHWGYGSAVAIEYDVLRRELRSEPMAAAGFYVLCQAMACTLFPVLGETPPPWKWRRGVLMSSLGEHALYVATVVVVSREIRQRRSAYALPTRSALSRGEHS